MFKIYPDILIENILKFVHQAKCIAIVVISFIPRHYIQHWERKWLRAKSFSGKDVIVNAAEWWYFGKVRNAEEYFIIPVAAIKHTWNATSIFKIEDGVVTPQTCSIESAFKKFFQVSKS